MSGEEMDKSRILEVKFKQWVPYKDKSVTLVKSGTLSGNTEGSSGRSLKSPSLSLLFGSRIV